MPELITVKNFKALKDTELILSNLTVIAGINNMGKSSLIQILLLIWQSFEQNTLTKDGLLLNGRLISIGNGRDALSADAENETFSVSLHWENNEQLQLEFACKRKSKLQTLRRIVPDQINPANILFAPAFSTWLPGEQIPKIFFLFPTMTSAPFILSATTANTQRIS